MFRKFAILALSLNVSSVLAYSGACQYVDYNGALETFEPTFVATMYLTGQTEMDITYEYAFYSYIQEVNSGCYFWESPSNPPEWEPTGNNNVFNMYLYGTVPSECSGLTYKFDAIGWFMAHYVVYFMGWPIPYDDLYPIEGIPCPQGPLYGTLTNP